MEESKEKAKEFIEFFTPYVYPFIGSSFLTGDESPEVILMLSKRCASKVVDELIKESCKDSEFKDPRVQELRIDFWMKVKEDVANYSE